MMSPMALRRTTSRRSNRGALAGREKEPVIKEPVILVPALAAIRAASRFSRPPPRARARMNDLAGRVILRITHNDDAASTGFDLGALGDALHRVVGALGMNIGANFGSEGAHVRFWKGYAGVHIGQRRQNFRAFFRRHHGPPFTF